MRKSLITLIIIALLISTGTYAYKTIISPRAEKPLIEEPPLQLSTQDAQGIAQEPEIEEEHIQYLVNELGGYNLHPNPINKEAAEMEFIVTDTDQTFTITIDNNYPEVIEGPAAHPDLRLRAKEAILIELLQADNFEEKVVEQVNRQDLIIEVLTDETTLAMKGYKVIYDALMTNNDTPTGYVTKQEFKNKLIWH